jgi:hypothetical protein
MGTPVVPPVRSTEADLSGLPPRLRERLERELGRNAMAPSSSLRNWLIGVSVVAILGIALILMQRFGAIDWPILRGAAGTRASHSNGPEGGLNTASHGDPTAALIDSLKREVETAKRSATVKPAAVAKDVSEPKRHADKPEDVGTAETPVPPPANAATAATATQAKDTTEPESNTNFGIGVASYLDIDRAREEKDKFVQSTTLPAVVVPFAEDGSTMYRVVLGRWATSGDAERAANALMERGLITEARVVMIPRK